MTPSCPDTAAVDIETQGPPLILAGSLRSLVIAGHEIQQALTLLNYHRIPQRDPLRYHLLEAGWQLGSLAEALGGTAATPEESHARKARQALRSLQGIVQRLSPLLQGALQTAEIDAKAEFGTPSAEVPAADAVRHSF
ncbi:MAG TPA: hypothetical protein VN719_06875 [Gemmatimonadales bacterium]|nr:hypothetical protein [Gemmatimonadales bacterium]